MRLPPKVATWLLTHFGSGANNEVLLGDLIERYQQGLPRMWYWKQSLKAIAAGAFNECRHHKLLTVRALVIGWIVMFLYFQTFQVPRDLAEALQSWSRWWRRNDSMSVAIFALDGVLFYLAAGWLIARLHRPHHVLLVLIFTASAYCVPWTALLIFVRYGLWHWPPLPSLVVIMNVVVPISILVGGGLFRKPVTG